MNRIADLDDPDDAKHRRASIPIYTSQFEPPDYGRDEPDYTDEE